MDPGTLFDPAYETAEIVPIDRVGGELRFYIEPGKDMLGNLPLDRPLGSFTYRAAMRHTEGDQPDSQDIDFQAIVLAEDQPVIES